MANYTSGEQFINKLYNNLINSEEVKRSVEKARKKGIKISNREDMLKAYFDRLEDVHDITRNRKLKNDNDSEENNEVRKESQIELKLKVLIHFYYEKYVIKELPEDYIELQKKIAKERGYGNIDVTEEMKEKMLEEVREEQKTSLDKWISYLTDNNAMYPTWFKYYAFQGMLKLGKFDKGKGEFTKRTSSTVTPFIECNPEILGQMYNILQKTINKQDLSDKEEQALSNGESFKKLYKYFLVGNYKEQENLEETKGVWIKYNQGGDYFPLWESLQGKNTGWCTAGEEMCKSQIEEGDFYVYYTYDKEGKPTNPRIAIRMDGEDSIGEIRGILPDQELEPEMLPILKEKLNEFPDKDEYLKKEHDMSLLTKIDKKTQNGEELTKEELRFLYEIDGKIEGFGWGRDPRIQEIKEKRNIKKDLSRYFDYSYSEDEIAVGFDGVNLKTKIIFANPRFGTNPIFITNPDIISKTKKLVEINKKIDQKKELTQEELIFIYERIDYSINDIHLFEINWYEGQVFRIKEKRDAKKDFFQIFKLYEGMAATNFDEVNENTKIIILNASFLKGDNQFRSFNVISDINVINKLNLLKKIFLIDKTEELTEEEIELLYEIKPLNVPFKNIINEKIFEIRKTRNYKKDLLKYFKMSSNLIAFSIDEINLKTEIAYVDNKFIKDEELSSYKEFLKIYESIKDERIIKDEDKKIIEKYENKLLYHYDITFREMIFKIIFKIEKLFEYDDIANDLGLTFQNVALSKEDLLKRDNIFMYAGDLKIEDTKVPDYLKSLKYIYGDAYFGKLESAEGLENLKTIYGDADFHSLKSGNGLCNLQEVSGYLDLSDLVDIGNLNQNIKIGKNGRTYDAYSPELILSEKFFTSENISNIKANSRFEKYLISYYDDFYQRDSNVTYRRLYEASEKELEEKLNTWAKEDALINEDNLEEKNNVDYSSYRNLDDLIDFYGRNGKWPEYIDNPVSNEDFINNELYEYRQELLEEEDYLDDDEREKLLDVDPSFFESYIY